MYRVAARLRFLLLCIFTTIIWVSAAGATELYIPPLKAEPGQSIDIPIMIDRVDNMAGLKLVLKYDHKILTFKKGFKTRHTNPLMHIVNDKKPGLLVIVMAGARGIKGKDFSILRLTFDIKKDLKGNHTTTLEITDIEMMSDQLKKIKCKVKVNPLIISSAPHPPPLSSTPLTGPGK